MNVKVNYLQVIIINETGLEKQHWSNVKLSERRASLGVAGTTTRAPLKYLRPSQYYNNEGFKGRSQLGSHDAERCHSLADSGCIFFPVLKLLMKEAHRWVALLIALIKSNFDCDDLFLIDLLPKNSSGWCHINWESVITINIWLIKNIYRNFHLYICISLYQSARLIERLKTLLKLSIYEIGI